MIIVKKKDEISKIAKSARVASFALKEIIKNVKPGVTSLDLDKIANRIIVSRGGNPSFLGFKGYPASICVSLNDELVHGLPNNRKIISGDMVKVDLGVELDGYHSDTAKTVFLGRPNKNHLRLMNGVKAALDQTIKFIRPGVRVGEIEEITGKVLKKHNLSSVLTLSGHGIGRDLHEEPSIKSDGDPKDGETIKEGMVLAIEPMATLGNGKVKLSHDGWSIKSIDGSFAAHFEHTIVVTRNGSKILT